MARAAHESCGLMCESSQSVIPKKANPVYGTQRAAAEPSAAGPVAFDCPACTAAMSVAVGRACNAKSDRIIRDL